MKNEYKYIMRLYNTENKKNIHFQIKEDFWKTKSKKIGKIIKNAIKKIQ